MANNDGLALEHVPAQFVTLARNKFDDLIADGFRDIEFLDHAAPNSRGWTFGVRHLITGVEVQILVDDVEMFAIWDGHRPEPDVRDFAAEGFEPVITYRPIQKAR